MIAADSGKLTRMRLPVERRSSTRKWACERSCERMLMRCPVKLSVDPDPSSSRARWCSTSGCVLVTRELLRDQRATDANQDHRLDALQTVVDELQQQLMQHTVVTLAQQEFLKRSIQRIASRYKQRTGNERYGMLFGQFCKALGTPRYDALPAHKYEQALDWI